MAATPEYLMDKIKQLSPVYLAEVEDFVDFLTERQARGDQGLTQRAMAASEPALEAIWDNPEDAAYDAL
jgi:hypothetical protein